MRLENAEGHVLMQIATYNDTTGLVAECHALLIVSFCSFGCGFGW